MRDPIERQAAIEALNRCTDVYYTNLPPLVDKEEVRRALASLPSAEPEIIRCNAYTDEEIQMMQDLEQAEIQKAYELGYEEGLKEKDNSRD